MSAGTESATKTPATVSHLCRLSGPSAVLGAVWPIGIDAVDRVFGRGLRPHVGYEILEGAACLRAPAVTDGDAATAVCGIRPMVRVAADEGQALGFSGWRLENAPAQG